MISILVLTFVGTIIGAGFIPSTNAGHSYDLNWLFGLDQRATDPKDDRPECNSTECKLIAKVITDSMNEAVDPCEDFYEYACGSWANKHPVKDNQAVYNLWFMMRDKLMNKMSDILKSKPKHDDVLPLKLAKKWFKSCTDTGRMEKVGLEPLLSTLWRFGGWPLIMEDEEWHERSHKWQNVDDHYARLMGLNAFHDVHLSYYNETLDEVLQIDVPHLPPKVMKLVEKQVPEDNYDESDENDEGEEDSQEKGSEESNDDKGEKSNEKNNRAKNEVKRKERKMKRKLSHRDTKGHNDKKSKKQEDERVVGKRSKKRSSKAKHHKGRKQSQLFKHWRDRKHGKSRVKSSRINKIFIHKIESFIEKSNSNENDDRSNDSQGDNESQSEENNDSESHGDDEDEDDKEDNEDNESEEKEEKDDEEVLANREEYSNYIFKVASALANERGTPVPVEKLNKRISDLIEFQIKLIKITELDSEHVLTTLNSLQEDYRATKANSKNSKVNWIKKVEILFTSGDLEFDEDMEILSSVSKYFEELRSLLDNTPSETIVNYVHWNFISRLLKATTKEMRHLYIEWNNKKESKKRFKECISEAQIAIIIGYEYVKQYISNDTLQAASDMFDDIQKEIEYQIEESPWMDEDTEDFILNKLVHMKKQISHPDWYQNDTIIKNIFEGLTVGPSYYENILIYSRHRKYKELQQLTEERIELPDDSVDPLMLNAFFMPEKNAIAVTAADFQSPFFASNQPRSINFGIMGFIIGHEVNHGFDSNNYSRDKRDEIKEWISTMSDAYKKRAECFVHQFNNYSTLRSENLTIENYGNRTVSENIADTMGLQATYKAYRRRERECKNPDAVLPGLEKFTNDQVFFLAYANLWCSNVGRDYMLTKGKRDAHSTGRLRIIGALSNSNDFAKTYNCPVGSPMNPKKKCSIWI